MGASAASGMVSWSETSARFSRKCGQAALVVLVGQAAQLLHVLPAVAAFFGAVVDVCFGRRCRPGCGRTGPAAAASAPGVAPAGQHRAEIGQQRARRAPDLRPMRRCPCRCAARSSSTCPALILRLAGGQLQRHQGLVADAARRDVDHAAQADLVGRVLHQAQVGDHVLDLAPPVEALRPDQPVGQPGAQEGLFQQAGLGVGAVHHREVARPARASSTTSCWIVSTTKAASP